MEHITLKPVGVVQNKFLQINASGELEATVYGESDIADISGSGANTPVYNSSISETVSAAGIYVLQPPASGADLTLTVPAASSENRGDQYRFVLDRLAGGTVGYNVQAESGDIGGSSTQYMGQDSRGFAMLSEGDKWIIIQNSRRSLSYTWQSPELETPNNADWAINSLAPAEADPNNAGFVIRSFDDTTVEGVGYSYLVPNWATKGSFQYLSRAANVSGGEVVPEFYFRTLSSNEGISGSSWSSWTPGITAAAIEMPPGEGWHFENRDVDLRLLGLTDDVDFQLQAELVRDTDNPDDTLIGDWYLYQIRFVLE